MEVRESKGGFLGSDVVNVARAGFVSIIHEGKADPAQGGLGGGAGRGEQDGSLGGELGGDGFRFTIFSRVVALPVIGRRGEFGFPSCESGLDRLKGEGAGEVAAQVIFYHGDDPEFTDEIPAFLEKL